MLRILPVILAAALAAGDSDYQSYGGDAHLGINMSNPSSSAQQRNNINSYTGVEVNSVLPGTAADRMGLRPGDVITNVNGTPINSMTDLRNEVGLSAPGDVAQVQVLRDGKPVTTQDRFGVWPANVPRDPIDAAAEKRVRDYQAQRTARASEKTAALAQQIDDFLRTRAPVSADPAKQPTADAIRISPLTAAPATAALAAVPAWKVDVRMASPVGVPAAAQQTAVEPVAASTGLAWSFRYQVGSQRTIEL